MLRDVRPSPLWSFSFALLLLSCSDVSGGGAGRECSADADCDDGEECTTNQCTADGVCAYPAVADRTECDGGAYQCLGGVCNKCIDPNNGSIKDCDDQNDCTLNECVPETGACADLPNNGEKCTPAEGELGICVERDCVETKICMVNGDCDGQNDCTARECDLGRSICLYAGCPDMAPATP